MALLAKSIQVMGKAMPKVLSPKAHAIADYSTAALFLAGSALFWGRSKRAVAGSLICGTAGIAVAALTDYPGGIKTGISFPLHKRIDFGLASMAATMPAFLAFEDDRETAFFRMQSALIALVATLTDFEPQLRAVEQERRTA